MMASRDPFPRGLRICLRDGASLGRTSVELARVGEIEIRSGRVVACDPLVLHETSPFVTSFPVGRWPVLATRLAKDGIVRDDDNIAVSVRFLDAEVATWGSAETSSAGGTSSGAYAVDSGFGCFFDLDGGLPSAQASHDVRFASGAGDGAYASFVGYDQAGAVVALTTAFQLHALDPLLDGGPVAVTAAEASSSTYDLRSLKLFLGEHGALSAEWEALVARDGQMARLWRECGSGFSLIDMLARCKHPQLVAAVAAWIDTLCEQASDERTMPDEAAALAARAREALAGEGDAIALFEDTLTLSIALDSAVASQGTREARNQRRDALGASLAARVRRIVSKPPALRTVLEAFCRRAG